MVAYFTGLGAGFERGSAASLGGFGLLGSSALGRGRDNVHVNAATGNLVITRQDEFLSGLGPDAFVARTYNSLGELTHDDNQDLWRQSSDRRIIATGSFDATNHTLSRLSADGALVTYTYKNWGDGSYYRTTDGAGAYDKIVHYAAAGLVAEHLIWTDGASGLTERYESDGASGWRLVRQSDADGNDISFEYVSGSPNKLKRMITSTNGAAEEIEYEWGVSDADGRISQVIVRYDGDFDATADEVLRRVAYGYDSNGRLSSVTIDLTPHDTLDSSTYTLSYAYDGTSKRVTEISQTDGSKLVIAYDSSDRVQWLTQTAAGTTDTRTTKLVYSSGRTDIVVYTQQYVNSSTPSLTTSLYFDASNRLTKIVNPPADGGATAQTVEYVYDDDGFGNSRGDLVRTIEKLSPSIWRRTDYAHDGHGNATTITTKLGTDGVNWTTDKTVERLYDANNNLVRESFTGSTASSASTTLHTRYVYDSENHLRFVVSAEGRVIEHRYDADGQLERTIEYADPAQRHGVGSSVLTEAGMDEWVGDIEDFSTTKVTDFSYDDRGNASETFAYSAADDETGDGVLALGHTRRIYSFDQSGQLLARQTAGQNSEAFLYDGLGRVILSTDLAGGATSIAFNDGARTTIVTTALVYDAINDEWDPTAQSYITTSTYNKAGELIAFTDSGSGPIRADQTYAYHYDKLGRLYWKESNTGYNVTTAYANTSSYFLYDNLGRKTAEIGHQGEVIEYRYDAAGRLIATASYTIQVSSTILGQLTNPEHTHTIASVRPTGHAYDLWSWTVYDGAGRVVQTIAGDGSVKAYTYDAAERLIATTGYFNKLTTSQINALIAAAATSVHTPSSDSRDVIERNFYDGDGRLVGVLDAEGFLKQIVYDSAGQKVRELGFANATNSSLRASGTFDALLGSITPDADRDGAMRYVYDGQGRLRFSIDALNYVTEFIYWEGPSGSAHLANGPVRKTIRYAIAVDAADDTLAELATALDPDSSDRVSYGVYNERGQLRYSVDAAGAVAQFSYDVAGRIVKTMAFKPLLDIALDEDAAQWEDDLDAWSAETENLTDARINRTYYNTRGEAVFTVDGEGYVTARTYDGAGRLFDELRYSSVVSVTDSTTTAQLAAMSKGTSVARNYRYDALGRINYEFDGVGNFVLTSYYANGMRASMYGSWGDNARTYYYYDRTGRRIQEVKATSEIHNSSLLGVTATTIGAAQRIASANGEYSALVTRLGEVQILHKGELIWSNNVRENVAGATYELKAETTGTLSAYRTVSGVTTQIWSVGPGGSGATFLQISNTGKLSLFRGTPSSVGAELWSSGTENVTAHESATIEIATSFIYDGLGNLVETTGPGASTFTYDKIGRVKTATNAVGVVTSYTYDAFGRGVKITEAHGLSIARTTYNYFDGLGRVHTSMDALGYVTRTTYTGFNEIESVTRHLVAATNFSSVTESVEPTTTGSVAVTAFEYDELGRIVESTDAAGGVELYEYNTFGQRSAMRNKIGGWTEYTYDERGLLVAEKVFFSARTPPESAVYATNSFVYDARRNLTQRTEAGLRVTNFTYNSADQLVSRSTNSVSVVTSVTGTTSSTAPTEQFIYDARGNLIEQIDALSARTLYWYDKLDRVTHKLSPTGILTRYFYNALDQVVETRTYADTMSLPSSARWGAPPNTAGANGYRATQYEYDAIGRLTKEKTPGVRTASYNGTLSISGTITLETIYQYDALGNVVKVTDPRGSATWSYYDLLGRKTIQIDAANYRTDWSYDANGNVTSERRYATAQSGAPTSVTSPPTAPSTDTDNDRVTNFTYDLMGRRLTETRLNVLVHNGSGGHTSQSAVISYSYNAQGQVATKTEATGDIIAYVYDEAGRMKSEQRYRDMGGGSYYSYIDYGGANVAPLIEYSYNGLSKLSSVKAVGAGSEANRVTDYVYRADGSLESVTDASGFKRTYVYDAAGRVIREEYNRTNLSSAANEAVGYEYDAEGRVIRQGVLVKVSSAWSRDGAQIDTATMAYNAFGEVIRTGIAHYTSGSQSSLVEAEYFEYDNAGRLIKTNSGDGAWKYFMHDGAGNQTIAFSALGMDFTSSTRDTIDEVIALWTGGVSTIATTNVADVTATIFKYDARNQATEVLEPKRQRNSSTSDDLTTTRAYNAFGDVSYEINVAGARVDYAYNTMGRRIKAESPAVAGRAENGNWYTGYNSSGVLQATSSTATTFRPTEHFYYDVAGRLVAQRDAATNLTRYTLLAGSGYGGTNALIAEVTGANGAVTRTKYDVHGDARRIEDPLYLSSAPNTHVTLQSFDAVGRIVSLNRSNIITEYYAYDGLGQRTKHWNNFYNSNGAPTNNVEETTYDHKGRVTQVVTMGGDTTTYAYAWDGSLGAAGMVSSAVSAFGGWVKTTTYANSKTMIEKTDVFGHDLHRTDLGGNVSTMTYDRAGRLIERSGGQTLHQTYYNTGRLATVHQTGGSRIVLSAGITGGGSDTFTYRGTDLTYDIAGNVVSQKLREVGSYQGTGYYDSEDQWVVPEPMEFNRVISDQSATFDALGRMVSWAEASANNSGPNIIKGSALGAATRALTYDAAGNIRRSLATIGATTQDYWYRYDAMNQTVTSKGAFSGSVGSGSIGRGSTGVDIFYNNDGTRAYTLNDISGARREDYAYDALGRTLEVKSGTNQSVAGAVAGVFEYDALGRLTEQTDYAGSTVAYSRTAEYNAKNQIVSDDVSAWQSGALYRSLSTYSYGSGTSYALGAATAIDTQKWKNGSDGAEADTRTENNYYWYDSAVMWFVDHDPDIAVSGVYSSGYYYDYVGGGVQLNYVEISDGRPRTVVFSSDMLGQVIGRDETDALSSVDPHENWYRYSGRELGYVGNNGYVNTDYAQTINQRAGSAGAPGSFADFDLAYNPINAYEQGSKGGVYTIQTGDTLQSIASKLWGDASLWWKLADVNGLTSESTLVEGQMLIIPVGVQTNANSATTFRPYDPLEVLGNLSPTSPKPAQYKLRGFWRSFTIIMAMVIAAWVTSFTYGQTSPYFITLFSQLGFATATKGAAVIAAGAVAGAAGSAASQVVLVSGGVQDKFSWNEVGVAAIGGAVGAALGAVGEVVRPLSSPAVQAVLGSAITQGISVAMGLQKDFSWAAVAAAGAGALASGGVRGNLSRMVDADRALPLSERRFPASFGEDDIKMIGIGANLLASAAARSMIEGSDFGDNVVAALPNVIGQTIGEAIAGGISGAAERRHRNRTIDALADVPAYEGRSREDLAAMADTLLRFDANNGERGEALRRVLASEGAQADLSDLLDVQRYETFAPYVGSSGDGDIVVTAPQPGTLEYALYTSQNAFQSIGGLSADDADFAVSQLANNMSAARASQGGVTPAFLSREVDTFMMGAGDTATWVAQEIGDRPLLRWSLEAVSIASGPAQYAIGKVLEPVSEPLMGELTAAAQDRFSSTGHSDPDSGRGATGVLAVGSLVVGTVAGAGVVRALEIFGRFRIAVDGAGALGGNLRIRPAPNSIGARRELQLAGSLLNRDLRSLTDAQIVRAFRDTDLTPDPHFMMRLRDPRLTGVGVRNLRDVQGILRRGFETDAGLGRTAYVRNGVGVVVAPDRTLVTITPW